MKAPADSLREAFLKPTLANAARLSFYKDLWQAADWQGIARLEQLEQLPTVDKQTYTKSLMRAEDALTDSALITHTSGTTGARTWRHRSLSEASVISRIFGLVERPAPIGVVLVMDHARHGMAMPVPSNVRSFPISISDNGELHHASLMLATDFMFEGQPRYPTGIVGGVQEIAVLIQYLLEHGRTVELDRIGSVHLLGFVDEALRRFVRASFPEATLLENFSLTEIFGSATRTYPAESFLLDRYVIGEVVDDQGRKVAAGEVGELTLTELFPFVQMQPLIRYRTGDVVQLVSDGKDFRFSWWGRRHQCACAASGGQKKWVLGYAALCNALSQNALVAREAHRPHLNVSHTDFGRFCLDLDQAEDGVLSLHLGVRFNLWDSQMRASFVEALWRILRGIASDPCDLRVRLILWHVPSKISSFEGVDGLAGVVFATAGLDTPPQAMVAARRRGRLDIYSAMQIL